MTLIVWSVYWWACNLNISSFQVSTTVIYDLSETEIIMLFNINVIPFNERVEWVIKRNEFARLSSSDNIETQVLFADGATWLRSLIVENYGIKALCVLVMFGAQKLSVDGQWRIVNINVAIKSS